MAMMMAMMMAMIVRMRRAILMVVVAMEYS